MVQQMNQVCCQINSCHSQLQPSASSIDGIDPQPRFPISRAAREHVRVGGGAAPGRREHVIRPAWHFAMSRKEDQHADESPLYDPPPLPPAVFH